MLPLRKSGHGSEIRILIFYLGDLSMDSLFYITEGDIDICRHLQYLIVIHGVHCCSDSAAQLSVVLVSVLGA